MGIQEETIDQIHPAP
jgi:hypothetical protein